MNHPTNTEWSHPLAEGLPAGGADIERRSHAIIDEKLAGLDLPATILPVVRRVVHASADVSFAETLRINPEAIERGVRAIRDGRPIFCDVRMLQAGITRSECEVVCRIRDDEIIAAAKAAGCTRAAAAFELMGEQLNGSIVAVGNAPTAIWKLLELAETRNIRPAVVVGLPVGFVGAAESKQALAESDLCSITNVGPRGGSPVAAAAVNALAVLAKDTTLNKRTDE